MKILWVKPGKLFPLDTGGKLRTYNLLRHLSAAHDVTYLSYYGGTRDQEYEQEIRKDVPGTVPILTGSRDATGFARALDYLRCLPQAAPYSVSRFTHAAVRQIVTEWIAQRQFDVAICDFLASALNFPRDLATPTVLFQHNVETLLWERRAQSEERPLDRWIARIEHTKMARFEPAQARRFHHVLVVSEQDCRAMATMVDAAHISVIPTGVDLAKYRYDPELRASAPLVVFTGSMDWTPNIDGIEFFCGEIWPQVLQHVPGARLRIVGRDPHRRVRKLAGESVELTGTVPSIVEHIREAAVLVVPLRMGGGTRIKIYEGMAMGKATVSTRVGAEGLDVRDGHDILLADDPCQFAGHVVGLLRDEKMRRQYEAAAAATAKKYDWSVVAVRLVEALKKTLGPLRRRSFQSRLPQTDR